LICRNSKTYSEIVTGQPSESVPNANICVNNSAVHSCAENTFERSSVSGADIPCAADTASEVSNLTNVQPDASNPVILSAQQLCTLSTDSGVASIPTTSSLPAAEKSSSTHKLVEQDIAVEAHSEISKGTADVSAVETKKLSVIDTVGNNESVALSSEDTDHVEISYERRLSRVKDLKVIDSDDSDIELDTRQDDKPDSKKEKEEEVEEKQIDASPNGRFLKFDKNIGRGSFKTVFKGLDTETGVHVAWCELQVKLNFGI